MRWPWGSWKPASKSGEPDGMLEGEGREDPAEGHHRHLHVEEHGDVETESASSEHWPALPVEEAVHVEDPAADESGGGGADEATSGSGSDDDDGYLGGGGRRSGWRGPRRRRRRRGSGVRRSGLPVSTFVGAAAAVLLALVAVVASWRRCRRHPAAGG